MVADRSEAALAAARRLLAGGEILAVKGIGGFQLACDALSSSAVARLRERKRRPAKALAVMVPDLAAAERLVLLSDGGRAALTSQRAPIVLAPRRAGAAMAEGIAPGLDDIGVLLPTTPLHVELFRGAVFAALVMTSGNASDEPICRSNREALARLTPIADAFLLHDRDVVRRVDDSVVRDGGDGVFVVRRARGHVPEPLRLPVAAPEPALALGGYLQATVCLALGREAFSSQHVGDLDAEAARAFLAEVAAGLEEFLEVEARLVVVDEHPDYPSAWLGDRLARARDGRVLPVQHHLAHAAAVLAEHGRFPAVGETALAVALDGTGWGEDETAWGGEWLELSGDLTWRRVAHLEPLPLVGGEAAVREPWRVLAAALARRGMADALGRLPVAESVPPERLRQVATLAASGEWAHASGAGRVFEAAGALVGAAVLNSYEGEAAARLEALAAACGETPEAWDVGAIAAGPAGEPVLASSALLAEAARRLLAGEARERVAAGFHATFAAAVSEVTRRVAAGRHASVAVGGGCLVNRLLRRDLVARLTAAGIETLLPAQAPPGDGGLSYGQAVIGAVALARRADPRYLGG
jgi:hydrogenase maturation protein HypF